MRVLRFLSAFSFTAVLLLLGSAHAVRAQHLVLNEVMYAPTAPEPEWIELYDPADSAVSLRGVTVKIGAKAVALPAGTVAPKGYVVLTKDTAQLRSVRPGSYRVLYCALPALRNTGDSLWLEDAAGSVLDTLFYQPSWGGSGGKSLERRDAEGESVRSNWVSCMAATGATPGERNSVALADYDLAIDSVAVSYAGDTIVFGCRLTNVGRNAVDGAAVLVVRNGSTISASPLNALPRDSAVRLSVAVVGEPLSSALYAVEVSSPEDTTHLNDTAWVRTLAGAPVRGVVLNEIMAAPVKPEPEWIELLNTTRDTIALEAWQLRVGKTIRALPSTPMLLAPDSLLVLSADDSTLRAIYGLPSDRVVRFSLPTLSNSGGSVALYDLRGRTVDSMSYGAAAAGVSIERIDPLWTGADSLNWSAPERPLTNTILRPNSARVRDLDLALVRAEREGDSIVLSVRDAGRSGIESFHVAALHVGIDTLEADLHRAIAYRDTARISLPWTRSSYGITSVRAFVSVAGDERSLNDSASLTLRDPVPFDSLAIDEICFAPPLYGCEWLEVFNASGVPVSLAGSSLLVRNGAALSHLPLGEMLVAPRDYAVIAANANFYNAFPKLRGDPRVMLLDRTSLLLPNDSASIVLVNFDTSAIDSVKYSAAWRTSLQAQSLERRSVTRSGMDRDNWAASGAGDGATPLAANSPATFVEPGPAVVAASFSPNPFSPDGDNFEDISKLAVKTPDGSTWGASVTIFDAAGRIVRQLTSSSIFTGALELQFDGRGDNGALLRPGLYTALIVLSSPEQSTIRKQIGVAIAGARR